MALGSRAGMRILANRRQMATSTVRVAAIAIWLASCGSSNVSRSVGARCDTDSECEDRCQSGDDYPGGFCTVGCDVEGDCPSRSSCVDRDSGICLFDCDLEDTGGCDFLGVGWRCEAVAAIGGGGEVSACVGDL